jgi:hypothetical protein
VTKSAAVRTASAPRRPDTGKDLRKGDPVQKSMTALHERYVWKVNEAVTEDRMELVQELNEEYVEEALRLILATA